MRRSPLSRARLAWKLLREYEADETARIATPDISYAEAIAKIAAFAAALDDASGDTYIPCSRDGAKRWREAAERHAAAHRTAQF